MQVWDIATCDYEGNLYHDPKVQDTKNPSLHNHDNKPINHMVVSSDGRYLLCGASDNTASLWDLEDEALVHTFAGHSGSVRMTCVPIGPSTACNSIIVILLLVPNLQYQSNHCNELCYIQARCSAKCLPRSNYNQIANNTIVKRLR